MVTLALLLLCAQIPQPWPAVAQAPPKLSPYTQARQRAIADKVPLVILVSADWCLPCQRMKRELTARGWIRRRDVAFVIVDVESDVGKQLAPKSLPTVYMYPDPLRGRRRVKAGYAGDEQLEAWLALPRLPLPPLETRRGTGSGGWTWPGMPSVAALERHLAESPHNYDAGYLRTLSDRQLITLHDAWHNRRSKPSRKPARRRGWFG